MVPAVKGEIMGDESASAATMEPRGEIRVVHHADGHEFRKIPLVVPPENSIGNRYSSNNSDLRDFIDPAIAKRGFAI